MQRILPEKLIPGRDYRILVQYYATHPIPPNIIRIGKFTALQQVGGATFARFTNVNSQTFGLQPNPLFNINEYYFYQPTEEVMYDKVMTQKGIADLAGSYWTKPGGRKSRKNKRKQSKKGKNRR
jgi:hypothetical protein